MTGIVITGHGQYAQGVMSAIQLVAGVPEQVQVVNFTKGEGIEELKSHMIQAINALESDDVLLMTDILGGSPFNVIQAGKEGIVDVSAMMEGTM